MLLFTELEKEQKGLPGSERLRERLRRNVRERRDHIFRLLLLIGVSAALGLLLAPSGPINLPDFREDEIADRDIRSPRNFEGLSDPEATAERRKAAAEEVLTVYDYEPLALETAAPRLSQAFARAREELAAQPPRKKGVAADETAETALRQAFLETLGVALAENDYQVLRRARFTEKLEEAMLVALHQLPYRQIVATREILLQEKKGRVLLRRIDPGGAGLERIERLEAFNDLDQAHRWIEKRLAQERGLAAAERMAAAAVVEALCSANVVVNRTETEQRIQQAVAEVKEVTIPLKKGEIIVRSGDRIKRTHLTLLQGMQRAGTQDNPAETAIGLGLLLLLLFLTLHLFGQTFIDKYQPRVRDLLFMSCLLLSAVVLAQLFQYAFNVFHANYPWFSPSSIKYLFPSALAAMVLRLALGWEITALFSVAAAAVLGLAFENSLSFTFYSLIGSLVGAASLRKSDSRSAMIKAGMSVSLVNLAVALAVLAAEGRTWPLFNAAAVLPDYGAFSALACAACSGAIIAFAILPASSAVELFGYVTDLKLVELSNLNNPLLNRLAIAAPGTYHHSRVVGQLVEAAAEAIGANPLLATVMAYYHDIGKIKQPHYFTENQERGEDRHNKLKPSMSKMIIVAHVTGGMEMGQEAKLPEEIIAAIPEHHGTNLITFFYNKALELADPGMGPIDENEYRYPGPKPQSKETAILMLADAVEATCKSLIDPTPAQLQGVVQKTMNRCFADGQLDDCQLTLADLHKIAKAFLRILGSIYKPRIDYPAPPIKEKRKGDEDLDSKPVKKEKAKSGDDENGGAEDLKRLGLAKE